MYCKIYLYINYIRPFNDPVVCSSRLSSSLITLKKASAISQPCGFYFCFFKKLILYIY